MVNGSFLVSAWPLRRIVVPVYIPFPVTVLEVGKLLDGVRGFARSVQYTFCLE
jgi:hypothetical protein